MKLKLKELRLEKRLTQRQVAELACMSVSYYTELETGKKQINAARMDALARVFGTTPAGLIAGGDATALQDASKKLARLTADQRAHVYQMIDLLLSNQQKD